MDAKRKLRYLTPAILLPVGIGLLFAGYHVNADVNHQVAASGSEATTSIIAQIIALFTGGGGATITAVVMYILNWLKARKDTKAVDPSAAVSGLGDTATGADPKEIIEFSAAFGGYMMDRKNPATFRRLVMAIKDIADGGYPSLKADVKDGDIVIVYSGLKSRLTDGTIPAPVNSLIPPPLPPAV